MTEGCLLRRANPVKEKTRHPRWFFFFQGTLKKNRRLAASHFTDTNTNEPHVAAFSSFASPFLLLLFLSPHPPAGQEPKVLNDPRVPAFYSFAPPLPSFSSSSFSLPPPTRRSGGQVNVTAERFISSSYISYISFSLIVARGSLAVLLVNVACQQQPVSSKLPVTV